MNAVEQPSRNQIRKAAKKVRTWWVAPEDAAITEEIATAWLIISGYRASFQRPLDKVTIQLRRFVGYEVQPVLVAQRLKRMPTIVNKLSRQPTMDLTRMQDIGGCRAVLPTLENVDAVLERITKHWPVDRTYDYVSEPKPSGYRAKHVVVVRDDRPIEIQLRTRTQQLWGQAVETTGTAIHAALKDGVGPDLYIEFFRMLGRMGALKDAGEIVDPEFAQRYESMGEAVRDDLEQRRQRLMEDENG